AVLACLMIITIIACSKKESGTPRAVENSQPPTKITSNTKLEANLQSSSKMNSIVNIVGGQYHLCILGIDKLKCWGMPYDLPPKDLKFPLNIASGYNELCSASVDGVKCWGESDKFADAQKFLSQFKHLKTFTLFSQHVWVTLDICALDSGAVNCWNSEMAKIDVPIFTSATEIGIGARHKCVIEDGKVKCWGKNCGYVLEVPKDLKNPRNLKVSSFHSCVMTDDGVRCWGSDRDDLCGFVVPHINQLYLTNPRSLTSGTYHTCAIGDEGVKCIGMNTEGQLNVPPGLKNPAAVYAADERTCAVTDEGVVCWGKKIKENGGWGGPEVIIPPDPLN
ncbi:MAG: RCC1 domain-containing protein, partial [Pseudobdellovibrionaceae bacterium]